MTEAPEAMPPEWDLREWEDVLNISVGVTYVCRECQNLVMITRGGVGIMKLVCCGKPMETVQAEKGRAPR
jgi:hypothetical protein